MNEHIEFIEYDYSPNAEKTDWNKDINALPYAFLPI